MFHQCPGEGQCDIWDATGGEYETRSKVCLDCPQCKGIAPPEFPRKEIQAANSENEIAELVDEIEDIVDRQNAGLPTDWTYYEFEYQNFVVEWRKAENYLKEIREQNFQNFMKSFFAED